ncbi:adhesin transport system outer membrane protein [Sphaerotilus hippei]|uniref:Adhesin transport system outer membrane protein n=1 Tax=Sphaerotilus hippei TaxID=744406 RepID=A0A318GY24_9BURK|nr:TolC family outer membrane protein [Sphaerotilus hippei]PXW94751.1 adhesin transport system outer membrane protein [Sphaerotilus hippei]
MKKAASHLIGVLALACQAAIAQPADPVKTAVQRAIATNPEVTARLNALRAASSETDVARSAYYPRLDLSAEVGRTSDRITTRTPASQSLTNTGIALSATQLLWDGLGTRNEVERLNHARLVRYFEFLDASEQAALETVRALMDVQRTTQLVKLAEDNYVQHRYVHDQIQSRVKAGVGRGVDLEQAAARLALAESNLTTETANLHDVTERYRRLVGAAPTLSSSLPTLFDKGMPASASTLLDQTAKRNVTVAAAVENFRAAQAQSSQKESSYQPRVEARIRSGLGRNFDGVADQRRDTTAGVVLNWNLFNGGADQARVRQSAHLLNQASDTRDKACRDTRQTAAIAFNDVRKLTEQIVYLDRNTLSSEKTRDAYRQQFEIGQRTLLDVLNAENELYTAKRALANAEHDLVTAKARTHAATSSLVAMLGLTRAGTAEDESSDGRYWQAGDDAALRCPLTPTDINATPKADLDSRARLLQTSATPVAAPVAAPKAAAVPAPKPAAPVADAAPSTPVSQRLLDWAATWSSKDVTRYVSFYDSKFVPSGSTRKAWFANRAQLLRAEGAVDLKISNVQRRTLANGQVETTFEQAYTAGGKTSKTNKTIAWQRSGQEWYIVKETSR